MAKAPKTTTAPAPFLSFLQTLTPEQQAQAKAFFAPQGATQAAAVADPNAFISDGIAAYRVFNKDSGERYPGIRIVGKSKPRWLSPDELEWVVKNVSELRKLMK